MSDAMLRSTVSATGDVNARFRQVNEPFIKSPMDDLSNSMETLCEKLMPKTRNLGQLHNFGTVFLHPNLFRDDLNNSAPIAGAAAASSKTSATSSSSSPLQLFVKAKKKINEIYTEVRNPPLSQYITDNL